MTGGLLLKVFEPDTFLGLNLTRLDLGFNRLDSVPSESLRGALSIDELVLDGLTADDLIPRSLEVSVCYSITIFMG